MAGKASEDGQRVETSKVERQEYPFFPGRHETQPGENSPPNLSKFGESVAERPERGKREGEQLRNCKTE